jgi:putative transposase
MARNARGPVGAGTYHVYTRSAGKIPFYRDDIDRTDFCNRLAKSVRAGRWTCLAFVLMTTHYHLLLEVEQDRLQPSMRWLNGSYAQRFNKRHGRWGHLCGSRYSLVPIRSGRQLRRCFRYIVLNPVRAGLAARPEEWTWSSYAGTAGYTELKFAFVDDRRIREHFGDDEHGTRRLRAFVEEAMTKSLPGTVPG